MPIKCYFTFVTQNIKRKLFFLSLLNTVNNLFYFEYWISYKKYLSHEESKLKPVSVFKVTDISCKVDGSKQAIGWLGALYAQ